MVCLDVYCEKGERIMIKYEKVDLSREYFKVWLSVPNVPDLYFEFEDFESAKNFYHEATKEGVYVDDVDSCGRHYVTLIEPGGITGGKIIQESA